jgi:hypothetical protein
MKNLSLLSTTALLCSIALGFSCSTDDAGSTAGGSATESGTDTGGIDSVGSASDSETSGASDSQSTTDSSSDSDASASDSDTDTSDTTDPTGGGGTLDCEGVIYECADGIDNDNDGLTDLADPECVGPCDDDEGSFATGLPGDNIDCFQDCFFDGNSGHGDDQCWWNITCDPANPGEGGMCEYNDSAMCNMTSPYDNDACAEFCMPLTPKGCDCFGCCTVTVDGEEIDIWIGSGEDCTSDNIEGCNTCTKSDFCSNDCDPDNCEVCFGGTLPEGCDEPGGCDNDMPCTVQADGTSNCPTGFYCLTGCCVALDPVG